jgi:hypothetical protein
VELPSEVTFGDLEIRIGDANALLDSVVVNQLDVNFELFQRSVDV